MTNKKVKKINNKTVIPVMFCFDNNYVIPASVAFLSLLEHVDENYFYKFYVLHSDITDENQTKLKQTIEKFSEFSELEFIDMTHEFEDLWSTIGTKGHFSKEVMYKVLVASIFPQYEKIIVSDVDVVFLGDISDSYLSFDVNEDYYLAGVKPVGKVMSYMDNYRPVFTEEEIEKLGSFCGGYLVFNLNKLRQDNMEQKFIECFEENGNRLNQMEQDVLTLCCYPNIKYLPLAYVTCSYVWDMYNDEYDLCNDINYSKDELTNALNNPIQLHYATSIKPWKNVDCTKSEEWFKYIAKTPLLNKYLSELPGKIITTKKEGADEIVRIMKTIIVRNTSRLLHFVKKIYLEIIADPLIFFRIRFYKRLINKLFLKSKLDDVSLLIIDDSFPSERSSFRFSEFMTYLYEINNSIALLINDKKQNKDSCDSLNNNERLINSFTSSHPVFNKRIVTDISNKKVKLAISVFLNNIHSNLSLLEKNKIPFVFTLYPGGGFSLNNDESDKKLKKVFSSAMFRKVIVTQKITYEYITNNNLCPLDKIELINGSVIDNHKLITKGVKKMRYGYEKDNLDICFVAHKYTNKGIDKGYDVFIEFAKIITKKHDNINFHIVGEFTDKDIDVNPLGDRIKFYGIKEHAWFSRFYSDKDIIISPNKPFILSDGSFDGFPLTCSLEAMANKVALFCTDDLKLNQSFVDGRDLVIINSTANDISKKVEYYYNNPDKLNFLSNFGHKAVGKHYSYKKQLKPRLKIIKRELKKL